MALVSRIAIFSALILAAALNAQTPTGNIEGLITDPGGALVGGGSVSVIESATGRTIRITTDDQGRYAAHGLLPGAYEVLAQATGFADRRVTSVTVNAGSVVTVAVALQIAPLGQTITTTADPVLIDASRHTLDSVITGAEIDSLPLFERNFLDLAGIAPGVQVRIGDFIDPTKAQVYRGVSIAGRSGKTTRVQLDGIDVTDEMAGSTVANFSPLSVSEFEIARSSLDPSTSITSTGSISIISRGGANRVHGSAFWDYYNQDMGARLEYNAAAVPFHRNRTGFSAGGPIVRDKLFWFVDWERHYQQEQLVTIVPDFPQLNLTQAAPIGIRYVDGRADWNATNAVRVFYRFHHDWNIATSGIPSSPSQLVNWTNTSTVGLEMSKGRMTHSYRFGYVNFNNRVQDGNPAVPFPQAPGGTPYFLAVWPFEAGPQSGQTNYIDTLQNSYEGALNVNRHILRFGFDARHIVLGYSGSFAMSVTGSRNAQIVSQIAASGGNVQDPTEYPLLNFTVSPQAGYVFLDPAHGMPHGGEYNTRLGAFVQDSIKLSRRLTLNLGLRWQYETRYFSNPAVPRDPVLDRWIPGAAAMPRFPKDCFSPSFGFAWDVRGDGKTVVRGGFYKGFERSLMFQDELLMMPPGIGWDIYTIAGVQGPDGTPIDVDGRHPAGNYTDLQGQPIKTAIGTIEAVNRAVEAAYRGYHFDPKSGASLFSQTAGLAGGALYPGNQFKIPYALQFNLGVQRQLARGVVLSADYVVNRAVGLPLATVDAERRLDAATLNVGAAQARMNTVLGGRSVDQWIAANPAGTISQFRMATDAIFTGLSPDYYRANFVRGGFANYRALQIGLNAYKGLAGPFKDLTVAANYTLSRAESIGAMAEFNFMGGSENSTPVTDNHNWNNRDGFGPSALDRTHMISAAVTFTMPGRVRFSSMWTFQTAPPLLISVPNLSAATAGANAFFASDLNGDGGPGVSPRTDLFPGLRSAGRAVKTIDDMNRVIADFNARYAGQLTPHGQALASAGLFTEAQLKNLGAVTPFVPLIPQNNPLPWHNLFVSDLSVDRPIKLARWRDGMEVAPFVAVFNLFNHAPAQIGDYGMFGTALAGLFGSMNFDYAHAPPGQQASDLDASRGRLNPTRKIMVGVRFSF